jgi:hypothetical protein
VAFGAAPTTDRRGQPSDAMFFDGNSRIDLPFAQGTTTEYTISAWFKTTEGGIIFLCSILPELFTLNISDCDSIPEERYKAILDIIFFS